MPGLVHIAGIKSFLLPFISFLIDMYCEQIHANLGYMTAVLQSFSKNQHLGFIFVAGEPHCLSRQCLKDDAYND
eukprot:scaffold10507_cov24-Prasinocladus_malaysianus.AAC.5